MMEIAVIGNDEFVTGFALAGVRTVYPVEENVEEKVEQVLKQPDVGILVMQQEQFKSLNNKTRKMLEKIVKPVLVVVSEEKQVDIRQMMKRSFGVNLK